MNLSSFEMANQALKQYARSTLGGSREYTLDTMIQFMEYLGNPQESYKTIHIAGTSGKTSTCYYTAGLLRQAGFKIGHTVSPHVDEVNERAQINLLPLNESEYCAELGKFLDIVQKSKLKLSYFEVTIAFAYWVFAKHNIDYAVVEVGLGGLLDGTNVIKRADKVCIITDIGYDHVEILGHTLEEIAAQKAGIINSHNTVFIKQQAEEVMQVIKRKCASEDAKLHIIADGGYSNERVLAHLPPFQQRNFGLAKEAVNFVASQHSKKLTPKQIEEAATTHVPARMEVVKLNDSMVILDGSHNTQKIQALVEGIYGRFPGSIDGAILLSLGQNKHRDSKKVIQILRSISDSIVLTSFSKYQDEVRQAIPPRELAQYCESAGYARIEIEEDPVKAFHAAAALDKQLVIVTGSYFLLNHIRPLLDLKTI